MERNRREECKEKDKGMRRIATVAKGPKKNVMLSEVEASLLRH
jgi:hypothetical protein